jgi:hypothetical protein
MPPAPFTNEARKKIGLGSIDLVRASAVEAAAVDVSPRCDLGEEGGVPDENHELHRSGAVLPRRGHRPLTCAIAVVDAPLLSVVVLEEWRAPARALRHRPCSIDELRRKLDLHRRRRPGEGRTQRTTSRDGGESTVVATAMWPCWEQALLRSGRYIGHAWGGGCVVRNERADASPLFCFISDHDK